MDGTAVPPEGRYTVFSCNPSRGICRVSIIEDGEEISNEDTMDYVDRLMREHGGSEL